ncbi:MAG: O-antigen ligase family protein [Pseudomonadota bacterium]
MKINIKSILDISLIFIFYAGFQGGKYFFNNRVQELGIALAFMLFFYAASKTALIKKDIYWSWWFWSAPLLIIYIMGLSSVVFSLNADTAILPSLFAAREFLIIILAPTLYYLFHLGYSLERFEKIFIISLIIVLANYLFHYWRIDLVSAYFSTGYMSYLVTFDEWRGYRLKPPTFALFLLTIYALLMLFKIKNSSLLKKVGWIILLCLSGYIWFLIKARSQMATLSLALLVYPLFFLRPNRINLLLLATPIGLFLLFSLGGFLVESFMNSNGGSIRSASYSLAWEQIKQHAILGYGQSSAYSKTYQDIFGAKFFPSDLGMVGITFKYGFIGVFIYIFYNFYIVRRLMRANWYYLYQHQHLNPLLMSLFILLIALTINLVLNPGLAYMQGLTVASVSIALTAAYNDINKQKLSA